MTTTMQTNGTDREAAMLADLMDAEPVTRLTEDENPFFSGGVDFDPLDEPEPGVFPEPWDLR